MKPRDLLLPHRQILRVSIGWFGAKCKVPAGGIDECRNALRRGHSQAKKTGYPVKAVPYGEVSANHEMLHTMVGGGLASEDDIIRIADGLDHLPTGKKFVVGQAVQLLSPIPPANMASGTIVTVVEVWPGIVVIEKGRHKVKVDPSSIRGFPLPESRST